MTPKQRKAKPRTWTEWRLVHGRRHEKLSLKTRSEADRCVVKGRWWEGWTPIRVTVTEQQPNRRKT